MNDKTILPDGYKPVTDAGALAGRVKKLTPAQEKLRQLMVRDERFKTEKDVKTQTQPPYRKLKNISDITSNNIQAKTNLRAITPYIKRAEQIWLTLLLRSTGVEEGYIDYDTKDSALKNSALHSQLTQRVETYFTTDYVIEDICPDMIVDCMFRTGSYILVDLPYSAIDHIINGMANSTITGMENIQQCVSVVSQSLTESCFTDATFSRAKNIGWISKNPPAQRHMGFEGLFTKPNYGTEYNLVNEAFKWTFTDNPMVLKAGQLRNYVVETQLGLQDGFERLDTLVQTNFEKGRGFKKINDNHVNIISERSFDKVTQEMYPDRHYEEHENIFVRKPAYYSNDVLYHGLTLHPPSESCIPVFLNGDRSKPLGYIFLTDSVTGDFLKSTGDIRYYSSNKHRQENNTKPDGMNSLNAIINNLKNISNGKDCDIDMDWATEMVNGLLEKEIVESFMNGGRACSVSVSLTDANIRLYLSRAIRQQGVRSVFIPASYVTYAALDFSELGIGQSLVDEAKLAITRLAILDMADMVANIENAISKSLLTIDLEEEDFNPQETIAKAKEEYLKSNPSLLSYVGFTSEPVDKIIDGIISSMVRIKINANDNRNIINPNIEESQDEHVGVKPIDSDSREYALNQVVNHFGLKRSWLDDSDQGNDFAIEALNEQKLLADTTAVRSRIFSMHLTDHARKHIRMNELLRQELLEIIKENKKLYEKPDQGGDLAEATACFKAGGFANGLPPSKDVKKGKQKAPWAQKENDASKANIILNDYLNNLTLTLPRPATVEQYNKLTEKLEAADRLVRGWKEIGVAEPSLRRILTEVGLQGIGDETNGTNSEYIMALLDGVLRKDAYQRFGITIPFDEIVSDGKEGGMVGFINQIADQERNTITFIEKLFKQMSKADNRLVSLAEKYKDGLRPTMGVTQTAFFDPNPGGPNEFAEEVVEEVEEELDEETEEIENDFSADTTEIDEATNEEDDTSL